MSGLVRLCWIVTVVATLPGAYLLISAFMDAQSAPQEAALAAMAMAVVVVPYIFTRAMEGLSKKDE